MYKLSAGPTIIISLLFRDFLPTGSEESTIMTSKQFSCSFTNRAASMNNYKCKYTFNFENTNSTRGSSKATAVELDKYFLAHSTTCLSISHMTIRSISGCLATSLKTPPSPPPTIKTYTLKLHDFYQQQQIEKYTLGITVSENGKVSD